jgi:hypothetical protein
MYHNQIYQVDVECNYFVSANYVDSIPVVMPSFSNGLLDRKRRLSVFRVESVRRRITSDAA